MILFIDTISKPCFIGLFDDNKNLIDSKIYDITGNESMTLNPNIDELLKKNNISYFDIENIVLINGPGSFTGIRTAVLVANTINFIIKKNMTGIDYFSMYEIAFPDNYPIIKDSSRRDLFIKKDNLSKIEIIPNEDLIAYLKENKISKIYGDTNINLDNTKKITNIDYVKVLNKIKLDNKTKLEAFYMKKPNIS
ncbi:MAG: tRNA (adenosine(37)-N6)-threonylcarbamoyltransferase complex dimerization subunit type 1 TsaB [Candidatus Gracilibacteria bacterium]|nr:tRNA (adenosine(37)-N6)-threonylcarbamoyltransferase complex dimerization subunit type 1 TsaB [Candidatus Gracilibacteria bacterium]